MNRRDAFKLGMVSTLVPTILAANVSATQAHTKTENQMNQINHSICSWCFTSRGPKWSFEKLCEVAKSLKCKSIELLTADSFATLKKHDLTCAISGTGMGYHHGFNNLAHRDELTTKTKAAIDAAKEAGVPSVIGFVGMKWNSPKDEKSGEISKDEAFKNCVEGLKAIAGHAEKAGVNLCIEHLNSRDATDPTATGHPGYQGDDLDFVMSILKAVGSKRVNLLFDVYHVQIMHGDIIKRLDDCKDFLGHIHTAGVPGRHELDETQEINYKPIMKKLISLGYKGYVGHEFLPTKDATAGLKQAIEVCTV